MEKILTNTGAEIPDEYKSFYDNDPYVVLDIPRGATREDADRAKRLLMVQFHTDKPENQSNPFATEILQRISEKHGEIIKDIEGGGVSSGAASESQDEVFKRVFAEGVEESKKHEEKFMSVIRSGNAESFAEWRRQALNRNISEEKIRELVNGEEVQVFLKQLFLKEVMKNGLNWRAYGGFINGWSGTGVRMKTYFSMPESMQFLQGRFNEQKNAVNLETPGPLKSLREDGLIQLKRDWKNFANVELY